MSDDVVIRAEGLGKKYLIGHEGKRERYTALRDVVARGARGFARSAIDMVRGRQLVAGDDVEEFWALQDVSFEIKRGDVVGVIGRNGAGKSTLLKILSRITEPSAGRVEIKGRVASLLEVGTGFHPELTGSENIYLNGAILGMAREEIHRKFDEIVAFAEVERFLDTPVKHYSSGMYVRLAFAVAAHLEPEILIVDEVLAVGDAEFQKKCLGKMQSVSAQDGRTVLFVSHNMAVVQNLCNRAILLVSGKLTEQGETRVVIQKYGDTSQGLSSSRGAAPGSRAYIDTARLQLIEKSDGRISIMFDLGIKSHEPITMAIEFRIFDALGCNVGWGSVGALRHRDKLTLGSGASQVSSVHDVSMLANGAYECSLYLSTPDIEYIDSFEKCLRFEINPKITTGGIKRMDQSWGFGAVEFPYVSHELESRLVCQP